MAAPAPRKPRDKDPDTKAFEKELADLLGLKVEIKRGSGESGNLIIKFGNFDQLDYIRMRLGGGSSGLSRCSAILTAPLDARAAACCVCRRTQCALAHARGIDHERDDTADATRGDHPARRRAIAPTTPIRASCSTPGRSKCAKKLGEEAVETVIAGVGESERR